MTTNRSSRTTDRRASTSRRTKAADATAIPPEGEQPRSESVSKAQTQQTPESKELTSMDDKPESQSSLTDSNTAVESAQPVQNTPKETVMSKPDVIDATATTESEGSSGAIQLHQQPSLSIANRPVMPSDIEIAGTIQSSGIRPIEASHMDVYGTILNGRPISASHLKVAEMLPGNRPVFYSDFHAAEGMDYFNGRPVMMSEPGLLEASSLPGGRPIFSNAIDDAPTLMGFLD